MSVRAKILASMAAIIIIMTTSFITLSHGFMTNLFSRYTFVVQQQDAQQWSDMLSYYYQTHHDSWSGVDQYVRKIKHRRLSDGLFSGLELLVIRDPQQDIVYAPKNPKVSMKSIIANGVEMPIVDEGKVVGSIVILNRNIQHLNVLRDQILSTMAKAIVIGALLTVIATLLVALRLSRMITLPLQQLIKAIQRIGAGDLRPQLPENARDEYGQVAVVFNRLAIQLARAEEARTHLVADVAHELRTPLHIILGHLELIQQGPKPLDPSTLLPIQDECIRLTRLVDDLHQLSLAEAGALPMNKSATDLVNLVERVLDNFGIEAEDRQIRVSFKPDEPIVMVSVDAHRLTQVFINLIGNALRYTPEDGEISVGMRREADMVFVSVKDNGRGIEADHLPNLFNRFYRVDSARSRMDGGMGLGLAIAKEFVEAHGGRIDVQSQLGEGTTFTVQLPLS